MFFSIKIVKTWFSHFTIIIDIIFSNQNFKGCVQLCNLLCTTRISILDIYNLTLKCMWSLRVCVYIYIYIYFPENRKQKTKITKTKTKTQYLQDIFCSTYQFNRKETIINEATKKRYPNFVKVKIHKSSKWCLLISLQ